MEEVEVINWQEPGKYLRETGNSPFLLLHEKSSIKIFLREIVRFHLCFRLLGKQGFGEPVDEFFFLLPLPLIFVGNTDKS